MKRSIQTLLVLVAATAVATPAFAIGDMVKQKDKVAIYTGGASADISDKAAHQWLYLGINGQYDL